MFFQLTVRVRMTDRFLRQPTRLFDSSLVDVAQDVIIREDDVELTVVLIRSIAEGKDDRAENAQLVVASRKLLNIQNRCSDYRSKCVDYRRQAREIVKAGGRSDYPSVFTRNTGHGVCRHCYGINLATGDAVKLEAVGNRCPIYRGTWSQLIMRTFHTGGLCHRYHAGSSSCPRNLWSPQS